MPVDGTQGGSEFGWGLGLVGGPERAQQPVVQLGIEDRDLDPVEGQDEAVGVLDPAGQPGHPEPPQVISHLAGV